MTNKIKSVIAVASGKGGVGKSTVAANLACALAKLDSTKKVGLLDADIYGPSQHIMFGLKNQNPVITPDQKLLPHTRYGLWLTSFGFFVKADEAVIWRGPMIARAFQQLINDVQWGEIDYLVVDLPPGTGDIQLTLSQALQVTGIVIVSTPQDVAVADAIKGINMFRKVNVEILGLIENMSTFSCPHCHHETPIFSQGGGKQKASEMNVPFLGELPLEVETRTAGDEGSPVVISHPESAQSKRFLEMAKTLKIKVDEIIKNKPATQPAPQNSSGPFQV